ncbi:MAG: thiamine biosynthesis protein [Minicystis sp.]
MICVVLVGCGPVPIVVGVSPLGSASASAPVVTSAPSQVASAPPRFSPRRANPLWIRARDPDPAERIRLAIAVGATGLLEGVEDGDEVAVTALGALPYADDAEIALGRLGELLRAGNGGARRALLEAILGIAGRPRQQREALDPEGVKRCAEALIAIAGQVSLPRDERALAVSAARALAEKGYVDAARIPGDLDPK